MDPNEIDLKSNLMIIEYSHSSPILKKPRVQQNKPLDVSGKQRKQRKQNEPNESDKQRKRNMFILYRKSRMDGRPKDITMTDFSKMISKEWKKMSDSDKNKWRTFYHLKRGCNDNDSHSSEGSLCNDSSNEKTKWQKVQKSIN